MTPYVIYSGQVEKPVPPLVDLINRVLDPDGPGPSDSEPSSSVQESAPSNPAGDPESLKLPLRNFIWGRKLVRDALPHPMIPPWLDPLDVDTDDPRKLPLCWYWVPFYPDMIFAYAERIRIAVYMTHENLNLKPGDLDTYKTWPKLVKWFEDQSGFTMHLHQVWDERKPLLTFFCNHEIPRVTEDMWEYINALLDDIGYPKDIEPMWYLDRRLNF